MLHELTSAFVLLLFVIDPFGNMPLVNALTANIDSARRRHIILRECLIAYAVLVAFMFGGLGFLAMLRLTPLALSIAGGIILFLIALRMVFHGPDQVFSDSSQGEPFIVPVAIPFIAGPSALATVMLAASREPDKVWLWTGALTIAMLFTALVLVAGNAIERRLGQRAVEAIQKLMGLILTAIAVQTLLNGIRQFQAG